MAEVVNLFAHQETIEDFVRREGVVCTSAVETRFGLSNLQARKALQQLAESGKIVKEEKRLSVDWGAVCQWRPSSE